MADVVVLHRDYHALPPGTELRTGEVVCYQGRMLEVQPGHHCRAGAGSFRCCRTGRGYCLVCGDLGDEARPDGAGTTVALTGQ